MARRVSPARALLLAAIRFYIDDCGWGDSKPAAQTPGPFTSPAFPDTMPGDPGT